MLNLLEPSDGKKFGASKVGDHHCLRKTPNGGMLQLNTKFDGLGTWRGVRKWKGGNCVAKAWPAYRILV
jgi:hypothetical protein